MFFVYHHIVICCAGLNLWRQLERSLSLSRILEISELWAFPLERTVWNTNCSSQVFFPLYLLSEWHYFCISLFIFTFPSVLRCSIAIVPSEAPEGSVSLPSPEINQPRTTSSETIITWSCLQRNVFAKEILALRTKYIFTFEVQAALSELISNTQVHVFWSGFLLFFYSMNVLESNFYCNAVCSNWKLQLCFCQSWAFRWWEVLNT